MKLREWHEAFEQGDFINVISTRPGIFVHTSPSTSSAISSRGFCTLATCSGMQDVEPLERGTGEFPQNLAVAL